MPTEQKYWFPAKRYGWGWGPPATWQGWIVFAAFIGLLIANAFAYSPRLYFWSYLFNTVVLSGVLIVICWLKGEPPRWRWGNDKVEKK